MHEELNSYFGAGVKMNGVLKFQGALRFDGLFQGEIKTSDTLIVGNNGKIEAKVSAGSLFNMGEIIGDIKAEEKISIYTNSHITGNIDTPVLKAEEGAVFMGNCHMPYNPPKAKSTKSNGDSRDPVTALLTNFEVSNQVPASGEKSEEGIESSLLSDAFSKLKKPIAVAAVFVGLYLAGSWFVQWSKEEIRDNSLSISIYTYYLGNDSGKVQRLADVRFNRGDYDKAAALYIQARRVSKGGIPLGKNLPIAVEKSKGMKEAAPYYEEYVKTNPSAMEIAEKLSTFYSKTGFAEGQIAVLETLLVSNPNDKDLAEKLYKLYLESDLTEKALNIFKSDIASKNPTSGDLMTIGNFEKKLDRISDSIKTFKKLVVLDRKNIDGHLALAYLYHKAGFEKKAAGEFRRVVRLDRGHVEALNNKGFENLSAGINDKALEFFNLALAKNPDNLRAYHGLATTYVKLGDGERAKYYCEKILEIDSGYAPALNRLAWILATEMKDLEKAEEYSIASMQYGRALPDYKDTLAEIYFRKGNVDEAIVTIKQALKLKPRNAWFKAQLQRFSETGNDASTGTPEDSGQTDDSAVTSEEGVSSTIGTTEEEPAEIAEPLPQ